MIKKTIFILIAAFFIAAPLNAYERIDLFDQNAIIIRVSDIRGFLTALEQSAPGQLWNSEAMKPFLNDQSLGDAIMNLFTDNYENKELKHIQLEGMKLIKGEVVFELSYTESGKTEMSVVTAMEKADFTKSIELLEREAELRKEITAPLRQNFQGVDIYRSDQKEKTGVISSWHAFCDGTYLFSSQREWIERCIVRLKHEPPATPSCPPMIQIQISDLFFKNMFDQASKKMTLKQEEQQQPEVNIFKALGLDRLKFVSINYILKPGGSEFTLSLKLNPSSTRSSGIWAILGTERIPMSHHLPYVPEDVSIYQVMRLDFNALWKEIPGIIKSINPKGADQFTVYLNMIGGMFQIDLSKDLFGNLGTLYTNYKRAEGVEEQGLHAFQLKDPLQITKILGKFFGETSPIRASMQKTLQVDELNGHTLYTFKTPDSTPPLPDDSQILRENTPPKVSTISISVIDDSLVFGTDQLVRSMIQAASNSKNICRFYESPAYKAMIRNTPEDAIGFSIVDLPRYIKPIIETLKMLYGGMNKPNIDSEPGKEPEESKQNALMTFLMNLRFDRLPSYDFMASYLGTPVGYTQYKNGEFITTSTVEYPKKK